MVELPWSFSGYLTQFWCFREEGDMPTAWRLRGSSDERGTIMAASRCFASHTVELLDLEDINFDVPRNARELCQLGQWHQALLVVHFVNCKFPLVKHWPQVFGPGSRSMFDNYRVLLTGCNLELADLHQLFPNMESA